jgi:hypothetical protein
MQHPLKTLSIIHKAMLIGQVIFAAVSVFLFASGIETPQMKEYDKTFQVIVIIAAAAGFLIGTNLYKKKIRQLRESSANAQEKFNQYRSASILLWALLEAPCLLAIIAFYLTANYAFIILAAALIFLFFIFGPNKQKLLVFLGLSEQEIEGLK